MSTTAVSATGGGTYGLSGSGMDIDAIVKKLMLSEQTKADALVQKKTVLQWKKAAYNTIYDDVNTFRGTTVFNTKLQANLSPNKVSSSNTSVLTATASAAAVAVNHSVVVGQLAGGVNLTSGKAISATQPPTLGTLATQLGMPANSAAFNIIITNGTSASQSIAIDPTVDSISDVVNKINSAGVNVQASYDSNLDRFFLATTTAGATSGISFAGSDQAGLNFIGNQLGLGGVSTADSGATYTSAPVNGQDAVFQLDGVSLTKPSNTFTIAGVAYNLTGVTPGATTSADHKTVTGSGQPTSLSITSDVSAAVANIQSFVDSYNKILDEVNGKLKETRYTDYPPLTDTQKTAMKDADIAAWTTKAQSGMLYSDSTLTTLVNNMRSALSNPVSGVTGPYTSAASIGITTGAYTEGGKLHLDVNKLTAALNANPNVLQQLFGASGATTTNGVTTTDSKSQGIAGRLYDGLQNTMNQLNKIAGTTANSQFDVSSNVAKSIVSYNKQIANETTRFNMVQKAYYTQYNAMEVALSKLSSQSSWLTSQMSASSTG